MTDQWQPLPRAREELQAARVLAGAGFGAAAVSRSYYPAFQADYGLASVPATEGETAAVDAEQVVGLIEAWIATKEAQLDPVGT